MSASTSIIIANLTTTQALVDSFLVEVYSDSGLTTLIGSGSCAVVPDGAGNFVQSEGIVIRNIPFGITYYARAGLVAPVSGSTVWSTTYTGTTGANTAPGTTYTHTFTPSVSGISVVSAPVSAPTDTLGYDAVWVLDSSTPVSTAKPNWSGNVDGAGNLVFFAGAPPSSVVRIFVRAVNTAYQYQAWTLLGSSTVASTVTGAATQIGVQQEAYTYAADTGSANAYAVTLSPAPTIVAGSLVVFKAANSSTGASTITVNGTSYPLTKNGTTAIASGDIVASQIYPARCDGTNFQVLVPSAGGAATYFGQGYATAAAGQYKFTLGSTPLANSVNLYNSGALVVPSDYTLSGAVVALNGASTFGAGNTAVVTWATANSTPGVATIGPGAPPVLRGTGIVTFTGSSVNVNWPAGSVAGDLAVILVGSGWDVQSSLLPLWTFDDLSVGANWNGAVFHEILTSSDISTGHVTVPLAGSFDGVAAVVVFQGATGGVKEIVAQRNASGSSSISLSTSSAPAPTDMVLYFGSNRAASTDTISLGTSQQTANNGGAASGALYSQVPGSTGVLSPTFSYSTAGAGNYQATIVIRGL